MSEGDEARQLRNPDQATVQSVSTGSERRSAQLRAPFFEPWIRGHIREITGDAEEASMHHSICMREVDRLDIPFAC